MHQGLDLGCNLDGFLKNKHISQLEAGVLASPNPADAEIRISSESKVIKNIIIFDNLGRAVRAIDKVNDTEFTLQRNDLRAGLYYAQVNFEDVSTLVKLNFIGK